MKDSLCCDRNGVEVIPPSPYNWRANCIRAKEEENIIANQSRTRERELQDQGRTTPWDYVGSYAARLRTEFYYKAPSFEAREAHRYLNNRLGLFRAKGGGLLDHPYAPCHPPSATPTEKHLGVSSYTTGIR